MSDLHDRPIGDIITELVLVRDERRAVKERDKELYKQYEALSEEILRRMDEEGVPKVSGPTATASVTEQEVVAFEDFDAFSEYVVTNSATYLFQRRPAQAAILELMKGGEEIPGIRTFTKRGLNLRKT